MSFAIRLDACYSVRVSANRKHSLREIVNSLLLDQPSFTVADVSVLTGTTRQAVQRGLAKLVRGGVLQVEGRARATRYRAGEGASTAAAPGSLRLGAARAADAPPEAAAPDFQRRLACAGLREDEVWEVAKRALPALSRAERANAAALLAYAFTEMLNNAIDHSRSAEVEIRVGAAAGRWWFEIADEGIGVFENVRAALALPDHLSALQELSKGKLSTMPERHSGEGLFFTSKVADSFALRGNGLAWLVDNLRGDHAVGSDSARPGTLVKFEIAPDKKESLQDVFARYTHDFEFDTTRTVVKLFQYGVSFVSRSEAKRLCEGLERFRHVVLDFRGVEAVGQGFADEVFRVWANAHRDVTLEAEHMAPPVAFMVERARRAAR